MVRLLRVLLVTFFATILARRRRGPGRPSWGLQFEWVVAFLRRDFTEMAEWPYSKLRRDLNARKYPSKALRRVRRESTTLAGLPAVWFRPPQAKPGTILFFHGGSYIFGSVATTHAEMVADLALRSGVSVVGIDYRLAPEHPYPAALEDALAAFEALLASGSAASSIVVAGDSAGGNLALCLQFALRDQGRAQARAALLVSPWLDLTGSRPSCQLADAVDYGQSWFLLRHARDFAGDVPLADPRVSPLNRALDHLSPLCVVVGSAERLFDEGRELVQKARDVGVEAELSIAEDMPHNPPAFAAFHVNADRALTDAARFAADVLRR